jgi:hypothetical protein
MAGNKQDAAKNTNDDDDAGDDQDRQTIQKLVGEFMAQADLVDGLFNLVVQLMKASPELSAFLTNYGNLNKMLCMGMVATDNFSLRMKFCTKVSQLVQEN